MKNNNLHKKLLFFFLLSMNIHHNTHGALYDKSRAGIFYSAAIMPRVSTFISSDKVIKLAHFHRAGMIVEVPYNKYISYGFSFDYTQAISQQFEDPRITNSIEKRKISTTFLGISGLVKPTIPVPVPYGDLIGYFSFQGGFGSSSPITAGTQPLSDFHYKGNTTFPSPFPLYLESSAQAGFDYFISEFFGIDLGFGFRALWVVHPMVHLPGKANDNPDGRSSLWYDITNMFVNISLKLVF